MGRSPHNTVKHFTFIEHLNHFHPTIKFTHECSYQSINYLDVTVQIEDGILTTTTFHKPTDANTYLHYKSSHPKSQKESIPYSQFLRMKRNCTTKEDSRNNITKLTKEFKSRGYPTTTLEVSQSAVANITQNCLLNHTPKPRKSSGKLIYVTTYHPNGPNIRKIFIDNTKVLSRHPHTAHIKDDSFLMAFKRPPNLRDTLVHSRFSQNDIPPAPGTWKCNKKKCHSCTHILEEPKFTNTDGTVTHSTRTIFSSNNPSNG